MREENGQVEIALPRPKRSNWTVSHVIAETLVEWGVDAVFGMLGHSNLGMAERCASRKAAASCVSSAFATRGRPPSPARATPR